MASERPKPQTGSGGSPGRDGTQTAPEREYESYVASQNERPGDGSPDVLLDVPVLNVEELNLEVEDLRAHVSARAEIADLVKVQVGVDAYLGNVKLEIKGVEAQALLKVRLDRILDTLDRALDAINRNPQILDRTLQGTGQALEGAGDAVGQAGEGVGQATQAAGDVSDAAGEAVRETGDTVEQTVEQAEESVGDLADLQIEEEFVDDQGRIVGRAHDEAGNVVEEILDEEGNLPDRPVEEGDAEVEATDAARRKAEELGVDLSSLEGTGAGGRVLVKDVEKAARAG